MASLAVAEAHTCLEPDAPKPTLDTSRSVGKGRASSR